MKFSTEEKPTYNFVHISEGQFVTGSKKNQKILGNLIDGMDPDDPFEPKEAKLKRGEYKGNETLELWLKDGENILSLRRLHMVQAMKYTGGRMVLKCWEVDTPTAEDPTMKSNQLKVEGEVENPEYQLIRENGESGPVNWEETVIQYADRLGWDAQALSKGRWVKAFPLGSDPLPHSAQETGGTEEAAETAGQAEDPADRIEPVEIAEGESFPEEMEGPQNPAGEEKKKKGWGIRFE